MATTYRADFPRGHSCQARYYRRMRSGILTRIRTISAAALKLVLQTFVDIIKQKTLSKLKLKGFECEIFWYFKQYKA